RWLMFQGLPQRYGTQFVPDGTRYRLWDVDAATSDADRAARNVPTLDEQAGRAEQMTRTLSQPPEAEAPWWLRDALRRWRQQAEDAAPHPEPSVQPDT